MSIAGVLALLLLAGGVLGVFQRRHFSLRWLLAAAVLVALNDFLLTDGYRLIPNLSHGYEWNWQGKVVALARVFPSDPASPETMAFQLTMPGFEEEPFYRGILLLALDRAFTGRVKILGVEWGWGALLSCAVFGLAHAFGYSHGHYTFDPMTMAMTAIPSVLGVWVRLRTGSLVLPIVLHNFGNSISLFV